MSKAFSIPNRHGDLIRGDIHLPVNTERAPVVIICHGFKGFKDWGGFPYAAEHLALHGFVAIRFNFSMNGVEDDYMNFTALHRFAKNTISRELDDLGDLLDAIARDGFLPEDVDTKRIALIGHSLGGGVVLVCGSTDDRVSAVITWAGVADFDRWGKQTKGIWREKGRLEIENARTGQLMPMDVVMLDDLEMHTEAFDIPAAASRMNKPLLIVHGEQDVSVSIDEGKKIASAASEGRCTFVAVHNTDHTFGIRHPFDGTTPAFLKVLETSCTWLDDQLA